MIPYIFPKHICFYYLCSRYYPLRMIPSLTLYLSTKVLRTGQLYFTFQTKQISFQAIDSVELFVALLHLSTLTYMATYFILYLYIVTKAKLNKMHRYISKSIVYFPSIVVRPSILILQTQFKALLDGKA